MGDRQAPIAPVASATGGRSTALNSESGGEPDRESADWRAAAQNRAGR